MRFVPSPGETRTELWARYDAGGLSTDELDARLKAVDRAGDDAAALQQALEGPVRAVRPGRRRRMVIVAAVVVCATVATAAVVAWPDSAGESAEPPPTGAPPEVIVEEPGALPQDCEALDDARDDLAEVPVDADEPPANPALMSDPPALPDGYTVADEVTLVPGSDPDLAMGIAAGNPLPVDVLARQLLGPLTVTMRTFVYESADAAEASGASVAGDAVCGYGGTIFAVPDRPEIAGTVVSGVIPTTAFATWRLGDRRFTVSVQAAVPDDAAATAEAEALAGEIAGLELDSARAGP